VTLWVSAVEHFSPFAAIGTWARWDSFEYLRTAQHGYNLSPCLGQTPGQPQRWCGSAGWFPGYSWLAGGLHLLGLPIAPAALAISWLAFLAALLVLWQAFLVHGPRWQSAIGLGYAAVAPGLVYNYAIFPISLLTLCTVGFLALLRRERWLLAGMAAAAATLCYPIGLVAAPVGAVWVLARRGVPVTARLRRTAAVIGPSLAALAIFALVEQVQTGHWDGYLLAQRKFNHAAQDPLVALRMAYRAVRRAPQHLTSAPAFMTLFLTFVIGCALIWVIAALVRRPGPSARFDALIMTWALAAWLEPYLTANVHAYRAQAALLPLALLVRRLPRPLGLALVLASIPLAVAMEILYLRGELV
jgi:hypothetical protein